MANDLRESSWTRARNDGYAVVGNAVGAGLGVLISAILGIGASFLFSVSDPRAQSILAAVLSIVSFVAVGAVVYLGFLAATPYRQRNEARDRVEELEDQRRPRMFIVPHFEDQFLKDEPGYLLRIRNEGHNDLENCYVRLEKVIWQTQTQGGQTVYKQLFTTDDIYFHWKAGGQERGYTFRDEAWCVIATRFRSGGAIDTYALSAIDMVTDNVQLRYAGTYFLVLQIGASNHDTVRRFYRLTPGRGHGDDGEWVEIEDELKVPRDYD